MLLTELTPDVTYGYDRRGRQTTITQGSTTTTRTYISLPVPQAQQPAQA